MFDEGRAKSIITMVAADDSTSKALPPDSEEGSEGPPGLEGEEGEKVLKPQKDQHGSGAGGSAAVGSPGGGMTQEAMFEMIKQCQNTMMEMKEDMWERQKKDREGQINGGGWDGGWNWRDEDEGKGNKGKGKGKTTMQYHWKTSISGYWERSKIQQKHIRGGCSI